MTFLTKTMNPDRFRIRAALIALCGVAVSPLARGSCELPARFQGVAPEFVASGSDIETWRAALDVAELQTLTLLRLNNRQWKPRVMDVREVSTLLAQQKQHQTPRYSVAETLALQTGDAVVATAGFSQTLSAPVPAGRPPPPLLPPA